MAEGDLSRAAMKELSPGSLRTSVGDLPAYPKEP